MDGASFMNWRSDDFLSALVLTPKDESSGTIRCEPLVGPGPSHGVVDLRCLDAQEYLLTAQTDKGIYAVRHVDPSSAKATRNEGRARDRAWTLRTDESGELLLVAEDMAVIDPRVLSLDAGLGAVLLTVGPLHGAVWHVELRRRNSIDRLVAWADPGGNPLSADFRFSAPHWSEARLDEAGEVTRWDAYAVRDDGIPTEVRLSWSGSGLDDVRSALRFRRSVARDCSGRVTVVRPYWTEDQQLSVELNRLENDEGFKA